MNTNANIRIPVDLTNPGQFFACCGLLELADRLWPGAEGWFESPHFCVTCAGSLRMLIERAGEATLNQVDPVTPCPHQLRSVIPSVQFVWTGGEMTKAGVRIS